MRETSFLFHVLNTNRCKLHESTNTPIFFSSFIMEHTDGEPQKTFITRASHALSNSDFSFAALNTLATEPIIDTQHIDRMYQDFKKRLDKQYSNGENPIDLHAILPGLVNCCLTVNNLQISHIDHAIMLVFIRSLLLAGNSPSTISRQLAVLNTPYQQYIDHPNTFVKTDYDQLIQTLERRFISCFKQAIGFRNIGGTPKHTRKNIHTNRRTRTHTRLSKKKGFPR